MDTADGNAKKKKGGWWQPTHTITVVTITTAAVFALAFSFTEGIPPAPWVAPVFSLGAGLLCGILQMRRLHALLSGALLGLAVGAASSLDLIRQAAQTPVFRLYMVVAATMVLFAVLGLLFGGFAEFVRLLHHLAHGGTLKEYPPAAKEEDPQEEGGPERPEGGAV